MISTTPDNFECLVESTHRVVVFAEIAFVHFPTEVEVEIVKVVMPKRNDFTYDPAVLFDKGVDIFPLIEHHSESLVQQIKEEIQARTLDNQNAFNDFDTDFQ